MTTPLNLKELRKLGFKGDWMTLKRGNIEVNAMEDDDRLNVYYATCNGIETRIRTFEQMEEYLIENLIEE